MHLLMSGMSGNKGGKETYITGMTRELVKLGDTVDFLTVDEPMAFEDEMSTIGCKIHHIPKRSVSPIGHRQAIAAVLASAPYDVIWSHKTSLSSIDDLEIAKCQGVGIRIVHSHCTENMGGRFTALMHAINRMRVAATATNFYACSQRAGEYFYPPSIEFQILKNAFDVEKYAFRSEARREVRKELGIGEGTFVLCHVGRFSPEKNHPKIVRVFTSVHSRCEDAELILCGDGPTRQAVEDLAKELGIEDNVMFLGAVDNVPSILSSSDVFIFPSYHEGLPYALLEAQANGLPCIVSDRIDLSGFAEDSICSLDLETSDESWAECCCSLASARTGVRSGFLKDGYSLIAESSRVHQELKNEIVQKERNGN